MHYFRGPGAPRPPPPPPPLPVSRQAIAKHLTVLEGVGLVEPVRAGREVRYRVLGAQLAATARRLEAIGAAWDRRLAAIKEIAEGL
jgi:DNA-binding transcriptional ArsR family regulator